MKNLLPFVFGFVAFATAVHALAEPESNVQSVEISAKANDYDIRREDTASAIVIGHDDLVKFGDNDLAEAIKRLPGVTVSTSGGIAMRGLGNGYTQILLNGDKAPAGFTFESLSPDMIERIEIRRSATADVSTQAIAGTINIVLRKAAKAARREFKASVLQGSGNFTPSVNWQISDNSNRESERAWALGGSGLHRHFDVTETEIQTGTDAQGTVDLRRTSSIHAISDNNVFTLSPQISMTPAGGDKFEVQAFLNAEHFAKRTVVVSTAQLGTPPDYPDDRQQFDSEVTTLRVDMLWTRRLAGGAKLESRIGINGNRRNGEFREQAFAKVDTPNLDGVTTSTIRESGLTTTGKYSTSLFDGHAAIIGWDGGDNKRRETRVEHDRALPGVAAYDSALAFDATLGRLAIYAQDEWTITPRLSLYAGLRWEAVDTRSEGNTFGQVHNRTSVMSPLLHALWKLSEDKRDQVRLALTRTFKSPTLYQLIPRPYTSTNNSAVNPDFQGNPALRPELAWGIDAACEHYGTGGAMVGINAYARRIRDYIRNNLLQVDGRWLSMPVNDGAANAHGLELDGKFPLRSLVAAGPDVELRANMARNWSSVDNVPGPDNRLDEQTRFNASIGADWHVRTGFITGGRYTFKTGGPVRVSATQTSDSSARRELEWYALWKLDRTMQLRMTLANLRRQDIVNVTGHVDQDGRVDVVNTRPTGTTMRVNLETTF
jgi:outer membrane receptor for ferrienterochelin and colicins